MNLMMNGESVNLTDNTIIATPPEAPPAKTFKEVVEQAMDNPLDLKPLKDYDLSGKKICIMVDDWGRPTPAGEFLPSVLKRLTQAGAYDADITIVTGSGMHDPMEEEDMLRKVGPEAFTRVRCISHDGGNHEMLSFVGITALGTPIWVNNYVAEADFKVALGRIHPHCSYGYEGGYKMIVPGVASFETIVRDHSINFSANSNYGYNLTNPSRKEADAVGKIVGIDFIVNFVMDFKQKPIIAYAGTPEAVYPAGVDYGQRYVWCAKTGKKADVVILASDSEGDMSLSNNPIYYLGLAQSIAEDDGIIIAAIDYKPRKRTVVDGLSLCDLSMSELLFMHERRDWKNLTKRQIQHIIKSIRGEFYYRRIFELGSQKLFIVGKNYPSVQLERWDARLFETIQEAYNEAAKEKKDGIVAAFPQAKNTLPIIDYDYK